MIYFTPLLPVSIVLMHLIYLAYNDGNDGGGSGRIRGEEWYISNFRIFDNSDSQGNFISERNWNDRWRLECERPLFDCLAYFKTENSYSKQTAIQVYISMRRKSCHRRYKPSEKGLEICNLSLLMTVFSIPNIFVSKA